jgi:hypothetical protein
MSKDKYEISSEGRELEEDWLVVWSDKVLVDLIGSLPIEKRKELVIFVRRGKRNSARHLGRIVEDIIQE